jgi:hypothetical protein
MPPQGRKTGERFDQAVLDTADALTSGLDIHDQVRAKLLKAIGIEQLRTAEDMPAEDSAIVLRSALVHLREAQRLHDRIGVKDRVKRAEKLLAAVELPNRTPAVPRPPDPLAPGAQGRIARCGGHGPQGRIGPDPHPVGRRAEMEKPLVDVPVPADPIRPRAARRAGKPGDQRRLLPRYRPGPSARGRAHPHQHHMAAPARRDPGRS